MGTEVPSGPGQYSDAHAASVGSHLMEIEAVDRWMEAYKAAWISNVPSEVAALFTDDAVYAVSPFAEPWAGINNTYYWIDPTKCVAAVFMTQVLPFADRIALALYRQFERGIYGAVNAG